MSVLPGIISDTLLVSTTTVHPAESGLKTVTVARVCDMLCPCETTLTNVPIAAAPRITSDLAITALIRQGTGAKSE